MVITMVSKTINQGSNPWGCVSKIFEGGMTMDDFYKSITDEVISRFSEINKDDTYVICEFYSRNVIYEFVRDYMDSQRIILDAKDFYVDNIIHRLMELGFPHKSENNYLENA